MATGLDIKTLRQSFARSDFFQNAALEIAESIMEDAKSDLKDEFDNHPVTREIEGGPDASNESGTLNGEGNLFSFIGFENGTNPTDSVRKEINSIRLIKSGAKKTVIGDGCVIEFKTTAGSIGEFERVTPLPWEAGRSWLLGIERGISGFGQFVSYALMGRSEGGYQSKNKLRPSSFKNIPYFSRMYRGFINKLGRT